MIDQSRKYIRDKTKKILFTKSGGQCANCKNSLTVGEDMIVEIAHIIGRSQKGPRVDDEIKHLEKYTIEKLKKMNYQRRLLYGLKEEL